MMKLNKISVTFECWDLFFWCSALDSRLFCFVQKSEKMGRSQHEGEQQTDYYTLGGGRSYSRYLQKGKFSYVLVSLFEEGGCYGSYYIVTLQPFFFLHFEL